MGCVVLVDVGCIWIPKHKAKLNATSKVIWHLAIWEALLEVEGGKVDVVTHCEHKNPPMNVSNALPLLLYGRVSPRVSSTFEDWAMLPSGILPPVLQIPGMYNIFKDRRLLCEGR
jgi:hypothetical protein